MFISNERFNVGKNADGIHPLAQYFYDTCFVDYKRYDVCDEEEKKRKNQAFRELFVNAVLQERGILPECEGYTLNQNDAAPSLFLDWKSLYWLVMDLVARAMAANKWNEIRHFPGTNFELSDFASMLLEPAVLIMKSCEIAEDGAILRKGKVIDDGKIEKDRGIKHYILASMRVARNGIANRSRTYIPCGIEHLTAKDREVLKKAVTGILTEEEKNGHPCLSVRGSLFGRKTVSLDDPLYPAGDQAADPNSQKEYLKIEFWSDFERAKKKLEGEMEQEAFDLLFNSLICVIKKNGNFNVKRNQEIASAWLCEKYGISPEEARQKIKHAYRQGREILEEMLKEYL